VDKIVAKGKKIAAHLLEAADTDIEFENGEFKVAGTDKKVPWGSVTLTAYVPHNFPLDKLEPGLNENAFYDPTNFTYPSGSYVCEVEVDPDTGKVQIESFVAVDDFGNIVNPMIVAGQVHGGIAQGLGQAMMEGCAYDPKSGQLLTGSFMDYAMPRASDIPNIKLATTNTPCSHNPMGVKGCGEAGAIGAPGGLHQRDHRRPRRRRRGDAGDGRARLARRPEQQRLNANGTRRTPCTDSTINARPAATRPRLPPAAPTPATSPAARA
jgi:carbon-monoxide dehydrogenase large subunit